MVPATRAFHPFVFSSCILRIHIFSFSMVSSARLIFMLLRIHPDHTPIFIAILILPSDFQNQEFLCRPLNEFKIYMNFCIRCHRDIKRILNYLFSKTFKWSILKKLFCALSHPVPSLLFLTSKHQLNFFFSSIFSSLKNCHMENFSPDLDTSNLPFRLLISPSKAKIILFLSSSL